MTLYDSIVENIRAGKTEFEYRNIEPKRIVKAYRSVLDDHPEFFWTGEACSWTTIRQGNEYTVLFHPRINCPADEIKSRGIALNAAVERAVRGTKTFSSEWVKAFYLHEWIVRTAEYDTSAKDLTYEQVMDRGKEDLYNAYGVLVDRRAVCSGYAKAYQLLLQRIGIECRRVSGGNHTWNIVRLNGKYYHVDVTWDDPIANGSVFSDSCHDYFCVSTREILQTHQIDPEENIPDCSDESDDFYHHFGLFLPVYSFDAVERIVSSYESKGKVEIKFESPQEFNRAVSELIDHNRFFDIQVIKGKYNTIKHNHDKLGRILKIKWFKE